MMKASSSPIWLALLHYNDKESSEITSPDFFIHDQGSVNPSLEMSATIEAFFKTPKEQCRLPARKVFIEKQLELTFPHVTCEELNAYRDGLEAKSISLVYASGYLGNPASMYGHLLLKINKEDKHDLLDNTYSYGARVPDSDNKFKYILKGIFGGYQGFYSNQKYHHQSLTYNESELRDLWEYRLKVNDETIDFIIAHLWEMQDIGMTYYFFRENCAYQLAQLITMGSNTNATPLEKPWVMPYDVVKSTKKSGLIETTVYHESRQEALYNKHAQLKQNEKSIVRDIIENGDTKRLDYLSEKSAKRIIETLYDYYSYLSSKNDGLTPNQKKIKQSLINKRFALTPGISEWEKIAPTPPENATPSTLLQLAFFNNNRLGTGQEIRFRASYYDWLNINPARIPFSSLESGDVRFRYYNQNKSWKLEQLSLFDIKSLNVSETGLPEDKEYAWRLAMGYGSVENSCQSCMTGYLKGFWGESKRITTNSAAYIALGANAQEYSESNSWLSLGPEVGWIWNPSSTWASSLTLSHHRFIDDVDKHIHHVNFDVRYSINQSWDVRSAYSFDGDTEYSLKLSYYW
ncbi:Lnb N-terminal periplasmic domain-containing protein [Salinivibrio sp. ML290]|uniref:Lnb N-terminal periplasmic domain-containing protein n=1 Tax=Salinivibrio sp. ML290 TaxID=1909468 RepID=UPI0009885543|nr:DUF4105 domain-containing protein [Salinivibrio sp. ML290]